MNTDNIFVVVKTQTKRIKQTTKRIKQTTG